MVTRIKTAAVMAVVFIAVMLLSGTPVLHFAVAVVCFIALGELYKTTLHDQPYWIRIPGLVFAVLYPLSYFFPKIPGMACVYVLMVVLFIIQLKHIDTIHFRDISIAFICAYLVTVTLTTVIGIRSLNHGAYLIWLAFLIPWASDTMAYFFGKAFGKKKLCPGISPKKTVVGAVAGVVGGTLIPVLFILFSRWRGLQVEHIAMFIIVGFICSVISEVGDLSASIIKRQFSTKDYGDIFPGHGGMMDRFDSVLFVAPVLYYYFMLVPILG